MKMLLLLAACLFDALLQKFLGFFHKLPVQVNRIRGHSLRGVVFLEDVLGGLLIEICHHLSVLFALVRQLLGEMAITTFVCLARL